MSNSSSETHRQTSVVTTPNSELHTSYNLSQWWTATHCCWLRTLPWCLHVCIRGRDRTCNI